MTNCNDIILTQFRTDILVIEKGGDYSLKADDVLPYQHQGVLGYGHNGFVEKVTDVRSGVAFARKTIRIPGTFGSEDRRRIFNNEVKIIRSLESHRHIIRVFATYIDKRDFGLILEPVADSGDLEDFLRQYREQWFTDNVMGSAILWRAFGCLASGLAFMHKQKVRHKDIKPRNILIHKGRYYFRKT
ncbi:hypothetical protein N0V90_005858 [Kalmusia sp. IMI 367209]|nr:hypothetical protein N0V90_005858 [Kalmusia sp. IMI 367209]